MGLLCREVFFGKKHENLLWGGYKRSPLILWLAKKKVYSYCCCKLGVYGL
ncbi:MAG: hypothetical protein ACTSRI_16065 [Promethearchaeota archaeon]